MPLRLSSKHSGEFGGVLPARITAGSNKSSNHSDTVETRIQNIAMVLLHFSHYHNAYGVVWKCSSIFQSLVVGASPSDGFVFTDKMLRRLTILEFIVL